MSTSFYPPFLLARLASTIDHIARGRFGWNVVTSAEDRSAQNFGLDKLCEHDERYAMADEYLDLVTKLWESWEPDAIVRDHVTGTYANHNKVHTVDFEGKYFKSRGPLNTAPLTAVPPDDRARPAPSPPGRELAAQARRHDRRPGQRRRGDEGLPRRHPRQDGGQRPRSRRLQGAVPGLADRRRHRTTRPWPSAHRWFSDPLYIEYMLAEISSITEIDFAQFDLDEPLPEL